MDIGGHRSALGGRWLVGAFLLVGAIAASADRVPLRDALAQDSLLDKALNQQATMRYRGVRSVEIRFGDRRVSNRESVLRDRARTRTEFLPGSASYGEVIVDDGSRRWHYFPSANEIHVLPSRNAEFEMMLTRMLNPRGGGVTVEDSEGKRIADLTTRRYDFRDRSGNTLQVLNVHTRSGLILRREIFDPVGTSLGSFEFTSVKFDVRFSESDFKIRREGAKVVTPQDRLRSISAELGMPLTALPTGEPYRLELVRKLDWPNVRAMVSIYVGDKGRFSLFQISGTVDRERLERLTPRRTRAVKWTKGTTSFVLVGDLEPAELERLANRLGR